MGIKLDLGKLKYLRSDAKTTTLKHPAGHEVTIHHNVLSPDNQKALKALSQSSKSYQTPLESDEIKHQNQAEFGRVIQKAHGGKVPSQEHTVWNQRGTHDEYRIDSHHATREEADKVARDLYLRGHRSQRVLPRGEQHNPNYKNDKKIEEFAQGGNAGEQRKKIFGSQSSPAKDSMREKHMSHINEYAKKQFGMEVAPSGGKINPKTGERRDESPEEGVDKPDWRSGKLESQSNPDAMMHELAHLVLLPKGVGLKKGQELMDKQYAEVQKKHGYMKQKRSQGEIQPMAAENILRRHIGLPAATQSVPVKEGEGPRMSVDTNEPAGTRVQKGSKTVDLIRQSRFLSPENRQRLEHVISGHLKFHPEHGWQENPDALGAKTRLYKEEHPDAVKKKMAEGGSVDNDPMSKIHAFVQSIKMADGGKVPVPDAPTDSATSDRQRNLNQASQVEQHSTDQSQAATASSPSQMWSNIQHAWAEGGEVKYNNPELAERGMASLKAKHPPMSEEMQYKHKTHDQFMKNTAGKPMQRTMKAHGGECYACGGPVQHYDEGGGVQPTEPDIPQEYLSPQQPPQGMQDFQPPSPEKSIIAPATQEARNWLVSPTDGPSSQVNPADIAATKADAMADQYKQKEAGAEQVAQAAHQQASEQAQPESSSQESLLSKGLAAEKAGAYGQGQAAGQLGELQAKSLESDIARKQSIADTFQKSFQDLNGERQAHIQDIQKGYIDPDLYWKGDAQGNGSHSKIAAGIGMVLAGFNPTNRPNAAIDFLTHQMDRNIDAQKTNLAAKNNLLQANLMQFKNMQDAADMTRIMQADVVKAQLTKDAAKVATPMAAAQAQSAIGAIDAKYQPLFLQLQMRRTMQSLGNGGSSAPGTVGAALSSLDMLNPEAARNYRERYYQPFDMPGGKSIADRPIPQDVRQTLNAQEVLDQKGKDILGYIKQNSGTWNPKKLSVASQKVEEMKNFYNDSIHGGALTEGRLGWYDEQFKKSPTDRLAQFMGNTAKLQEMVSSNDARKNITLGSYGLKPPKPAGTHPMEGQTIKNNQTGQRMIMKNGQWTPLGR